MKVHKLTSSEVLKQLSTAPEASKASDLRKLRTQREHFIGVFGEHTFIIVGSPSDYEDKVFVVLRNADFTEGRGPMLVDSVYSTMEKAIDYILTRDGIYGSKQRITHMIGVNIRGELYAYSTFNGFEIRPTVLN